MRKFSIIILLSFFSKFLSAQINLVPNPSFEVYTVCPSGVNTGTPDVVQSLSAWFTGLNSPECFNACAPISSNVNSPANLFGYRQPFEGNGYAGFIAFSTSSSYREILSAQLINPMVTGTKYFVSFRISLAGNYSYNCCGVNKIGLKFSKNKLDINNPNSINNISHVYSNLTVTDTLNWTLVKGVFVSDSNYNYVNIGNFFDIVNTGTVNVNPSSSIAFYYVDDARTSTDSLFGHAAGVKEYFNESELIMFPNPVVDCLSIESKNNQIIVYNITGITGKIIISDEIKLPTKINLAHINPGMYYITIKLKNSTTTINKIIIKQ